MSVIAHTLNPLNRPKLREALIWHEHGQQTSPRSMSGLYTQTLLDEIARLRTMLARRDVHPYEVRLHWCGDGAKPLPLDAQPMLWSMRVEGYVSKAYEIIERMIDQRLSDEERAKEPYSNPMLIAISEQGTMEVDTEFSVYELGYWNAERTGPAGICFVRLPDVQPPDHGLRLVWERIYG